MHANEANLGKLLEGEKQYLVPLYQRRYSWKKPQLQQLWDDITELMDDPTRESHFIGSIVLAPVTNGASEIQAWIVVDGQQRLTTLSILLCAMRDFVKESNDTLARKIQVHYLTNDFESGNSWYKIVPTQADRPAWAALVMGGHNAGGEDNIGDAYRFFSRQLIALAEPESRVLTKLEHAVSKRISFVEIAAHRDDNVHRIFESLNNTGLQLTQADLLRNYLFMCLPGRADRIYEQHWLHIQELFNGTQLVELLWIDLILGGDERATQKSAYRSHQIRLEGKSEDEIEEWISELHKTARIFRKVANPQEEEDPTVRRALDRLDRWGAQVVKPIATHILIAWKLNRISSQEVSDSLRIIESYQVRRMLTRAGSSGNNMMFLGLIKSLGGAAPTPSEVKRILSGKGRRFPSDEQVREAVLNIPFYWHGKQYQKMFILRCLEESYEHAEPIDYNNSDLTIEHILPQTLTPEWKESLSGSLDEFESVEELHHTLVHTLGNLTLSAYNEKMGNDSYPNKRKILERSALMLNKEAATSTKWGAEEIVSRGNAIAERVTKIWPGPDGSTAEIDNDPRIDLVKQAVSEIPAGRWTTFSCISQVTGAHPVTIGIWVSKIKMPNAHRILKSSEKASQEGAFMVDSPLSQRSLLEAEGISFDRFGKAAVAQMINGVELAANLAPVEDQPS